MFSHGFILSVYQLKALTWSGETVIKPLESEQTFKILVKKSIQYQGGADGLVV